MKIIVTILVALSLTLTRADISLNTAYSLNSNNNIPKVYYMQHQHLQNPNQQSQYAQQNIIPVSFLKPNTQYLPQPQPILPEQHNPSYVHTKQQRQLQHQFAVELPMPSDFPSTFNFQPAVKPAGRYRPHSRIPKKPIVTKNFFIHTAPEESQAEIDEELAALQQQPRKHYNVLFVKTPSQTNKAIALHLAKALREEKTVVYVLAKKTSAADLRDAVQEYPQSNNKPEVFFIKYRTPEEAANAQRQIQSQYDSLGGTTIISDEGIAPATSVIGALDAPNDDDDDDNDDGANEENEHQPQELQQEQPLVHNSPQEVKTSGHFEQQQLVNSLSAPANEGYLPPPNQY